MKIAFAVWVTLILVVFFVYVGFAFPTLNEGKAAELWGAQNKWIWYAQFLFFHFLFALVPICLGGLLIWVINRLS